MFLLLRDIVARSGVEDLLRSPRLSDLNAIRSSSDHLSCQLPTTLSSEIQWQARTFWRHQVELLGAVLALQSGRAFSATDPKPLRILQLLVDAIRSVRSGFIEFFMIRGLLPFAASLPVSADTFEFVQDNPSRSNGPFETQFQNALDQMAALAKPMLLEAFANLYAGVKGQLWTFWIDALQVCALSVFLPGLPIQEIVDHELVLMDLQAWQDFNSQRTTLNRIVR